MATRVGPELAAAGAWPLGAAPADPWVGLGFAGAQASITSARVARRLIAVHRFAMIAPPLWAAYRSSIGRLTELTLRRTWATRSEPDARVDERIDGVDRQIDCHKSDGVHQHDARDQRIIARGDAGDQEVADAGPREHGLHDDRASEQGAQLEADDGHDRDQGVAQDVAPEDHAVHQALGPRHEHV